MSILWLWDDTFVKFPSLPYCVDVWELWWSHLCYHHSLGHVYTTTWSKGKGFLLPFQKLSVLKRIDANSQGSTILTESSRQSSSWHSHRASLTTVLPVNTDKRQRFQSSRSGAWFQIQAPFSCKRTARTQPILAVFGHFHCRVNMPLIRWTAKQMWPCSKHTHTYIHRHAPRLFKFWACFCCRVCWFRSKCQTCLIEPQWDGVAGCLCWRFNQAQPVLTPI